MISSKIIRETLIGFKNCRNHSRKISITAKKFNKPKSEMKYILVTGGVISGVGKGVIASSFGTLLNCSGISVTSLKIDPYLYQNILIFIHVVIYFFFLVTLILTLAHSALTNMVRFFSIYK